MNKIYLGAIIAMGTMCLLGFGLIGGGLKAASDIRSDATAWAERHLPQLFANWDPKVMKQLAADEMIRQSGEASIDKDLKELRRLLGPMRKLNSVRSTKFNAQAFTGSGSSIRVLVEAQAQFERRDAQIDVRLIKESGSWRIASLYLTDPGRAAS